MKRLYAEGEDDLSIHYSHIHLAIIWSALQIQIMCTDCAVYFEMDTEEGEEEALFDHEHIISIKWDLSHGGYQ